MQPTKDMTETEIHQSATQDWLRILARMWTAIGKTPDPAMLMIYQEELGDIPLGILEKAVSLVLRGHQYNNVPTIGDVWGAIKTELGIEFSAQLEGAIADWEQRRWFSITAQFKRLDEAAI
jgi:hypothetical protein